MFVFVIFECTHTHKQVNVWKTNTAKKLHAFGISQKEDHVLYDSMSMLPKMF